MLESAWVPLYAAAIAAMVAVIVALINARSARKLDANRVRREYLLKQVGPSLEVIDNWYREYWNLLEQGDDWEVLAHLKRPPSHAERRAWRTVRLYIPDRGLAWWFYSRRYEKLMKAREFFIRVLQRKLQDESRGVKPPDDPRIRMLDVEVDIFAGPTHGYIELAEAWGELRRTIIKAVFR